MMTGRKKAYTALLSEATSIQTGLSAKITALCDEYCPPCVSQKEIFATHMINIAAKLFKEETMKRTFKFQRTQIERAEQQKASAELKLKEKEKVFGNPERSVQELIDNALVKHKLIDQQSKANEPIETLSTAITKAALNAQKDNDKVKDKTTKSNNQQPSTKQSNKQSNKQSKQKSSKKNKSKKKNSTKKPRKKTSKKKSSKKSSDKNSTTGPTTRSTTSKTRKKNKKGKTGQEE
jgi:hypothetical protein